MVGQHRCEGGDAHASVEAVVVHVVDAIVNPLLQGDVRFRIANSIVIIWDLKQKDSQSISSYC